MMNITGFQPDLLRFGGRKRYNRDRDGFIRMNRDLREHLNRGEAVKTIGFGPYLALLDNIGLPHLAVFNQDQRELADREHTDKVEQEQAKDEQEQAKDSYTPSQRFICATSDELEAYVRNHPAAAPYIQAEPEPADSTPEAPGQSEP